MAFPSDPRNVRTEMFIDGAWVDVTAARDVLERDPITIVYGRADENSTAQPSSCAATLNNAGGDYSPRNPLGPYYGKIGRNTPMRVWIPGVALLLPGGADAASTPDHASVSITGDIDIRLDLTPITPDQWADGHDLIGKWTVAGNQRSWQVITLGSDLYFRWSPDGTATKVVAAPLPTPATARAAVRVTMDVNDGAGSHAVTFYTGPTIAGPWTPLGPPVVAAGGGTTSIFDSTAPVRIGAASSASGDTWASSMKSDVHKAELRSGINGTLVASPNFNTLTAGATGFTDASGRAWTLVGSATVAAGRAPIYPRFHGEIAELPPRWDSGGRDAHVPITANGLLRRIGQGNQPVASSLKAFLTATSPVTYWPLDDGATSTAGAPAAGTYLSPFTKTSNAVWQFAQGILSTYLPQSLRFYDSNTPGDGYYFGYCYSEAVQPGALAWEFVYRLDTSIYDGVMSDWTVEALVAGNFNGLDSWMLEFRPGANSDVRLTLITDVTGDRITTVLADSVALAALADSQLHHVRLELTQDGSDLDYIVYVDGVSVISGTRSSHFLAYSQSVIVHYDRVAGEDMMTFGHLIVWEDANIPPIADTTVPARGFLGETAGRRVERLCGEEGVPFVSVGDLDNTLAMGLQYDDQFSTQLAEIENTDNGMAYEPRDSLAYGYRTRASLYNQAPAVTLDFSLGQLAAPFEPVADDQQTRNDVFAQRREGSSYQATKETGALSVQDPPDGVGRYKDEVPNNVESDAMLPELAGWLLHLGTVDEDRYPQITVRLHARSIAADPALSSALLGAGVGDKIVITNAAALNIYDDISLLVLGYVETIGVHEHTIVFNCGPASPYDVAQLNDGVSRVSSGEGSTLAEAMTTTETGMDVASAGFLWTTAPGEMPIPIMVGGEEMSVTAISGASSPQTFTVTRSVNGVVKTHDIGAVVRLKHPATLAL